MNCEQARDWLLQADGPRPDAGASLEIIGHLRDCEACRGFAGEIQRLEQAWREMPIPAESDAARLAFLARLAQPAERSRRFVLQRWAIAAVLLIGMGIGLWLLSRPQRAAAGPPLIEQLIDWNLELAAAAPAERAAIWASREPTLAQEMKHGQLLAAERDLARLLLETGSWLTSNHDPIDMAEQFSLIADRLADHLATAVSGNDQPAMDRYARLQHLVAQRGVSVQLARAEETGVLNFDNERRLEKVILRDSRRMNQLIDLLERHPDLKRKDIRLAFDLPVRPRWSGLTIDIDAPDSRSVSVNVPLTFQLKLRNQSGHALSKARLVITLPENVNVQSAQGPTNPRHDGPHLIFRLPSVAGGSESRFAITVKTGQPGIFRFRAELYARQLGYQPLLRQQQVMVLDQ